MAEAAKRARQRRARGGWVLLLVLAALAGRPGVGRADPPDTAAPAPAPSPEITQTSCVDCYGGLPPLPVLAPDPEGPACNCGSGQCVPGRTKPCYPCTAKTRLGRFLCGLYCCICCPDPCYDPRWIPLADSAFFTEATRPVTQTRLRWDSGAGVILPDRSEFFWARADGRGKGPPPRAPFKAETGLRYNDLVMITEGGTGAVTLIVETPYRNLQAEQLQHAAGFSDMKIATKTLIFDCELLQAAFMFRTYLPTGNFRKGLGVGHVSLEPTLLVAIKLTPTTYFQGQLSEWIPIAGDPTYQGSILHSHLSFNQELCRVLPDCPLIGTFEFVAYSFQDGNYTDPFLGPFQKSSGTTYASLGGGLRFFVCDRIDFGMGAAFSLTEQHFARELYRMEFRWRY